MKCSIEELYLIPELEQVPSEQLDWLRQQSIVSILQTRDFLFKKGDDITHM